MWTFVKQTILVSYIGVSLYAASFVISLLGGFALDHPVLGPTPVLLQHIQTILISSVAVTSSVHLGAYANRPTLRRA